MKTKNKALQIHSEESLARGKSLTPEQVVKFLEDFRLLHKSATQQKSKLISLKVPEPLLNAFKSKAKVMGLKYQTQIKTLMEEWLTKS